MVKDRCATFQAARGDPMRTIDVHAHCVPEALLDALAGTDLLGARVVKQDDRVELSIGDGPSRRVPVGLYDLPDRLAAMDGGGVDVQVLSPWMSLTAGLVDRAVAADLSRVANDALAAVAGQRPNRFLALADLPLQDPVVAADELRRAVTELGMVGAEIATRPAGRELDDPALDTVWNAARELDCMVLVHPHRSLQGRGVERHFLDNLVGNPAESTVAIGHLVFGGVADRHPEVRFCFVHGGGFAPYQVGRWDHAYRQDARGAAANVRTAPGELLRRMWFDSVVHSAAALRHLLAVVGDHQVVMGSDHPFEMGDPDPLGSVRAVSDDGRLEQLAGGNAVRLLGSHGARAAAPR
jgi:aminocarboxymuconate-semialdehyde decarboxylase